MYSHQSAASMAVARPLGLNSLELILNLALLHELNLQQRELAPQLSHLGVAVHRLIIALADQPSAFV